ncbi:hypothetical protein EJ02DRAFT_450714 [Clathrospora elynae]|uniref:TAFII55 protein conserved region domain-containing protein n=1 Tax=Clathrospora elynae TaxID=706981 RepID=A0A6A5SZX2_9PLEO|nr:hypothetical protein EJ02DRAFT_450714 [Clathrospora elynae]
MKMKLKLNNPKTAPSDAPAQPPQQDAPTPVSAKGPGLKIKFKSASSAPPTPVDGADSQNGDASKMKRKYNKKPKLDDGGNIIPPGKPGPKKRTREEGDDVDSPAAKRKPKPTAKSLAMANESEDDDDLTPPARAPPPRPLANHAHNRTPSIKISIKTKGGMGAPRNGTAILKVKGAGKPPVRPYGVGYDSEAEEAEPDPAIESQFVLRMKPGPDCDLLRKSIEEKTIGKGTSHGGPSVHFRFFDREGRRAMLTIQGRMYAATMVELPAVIESLKSWNKKDWVKTADVCQMLLVLDRVQNEEEAKKFPLPSYVEKDSHRFPHGLTPPMKWARKLRFRPRKSYIDVERAEAQMNRLLADDEKAASTKYEMVDSEVGSSEEESSSEEEDEEMANASQMEEVAIDQVDDADLEKMLHAGLLDDDVEITGTGEDLSALLANNSVRVETPTAHDAAMHAIGNNGSMMVETETAASTPAAATSADDDDDDDDADSDEDVDEVDEAAVAEEQRQEQLRTEIAELEKAIAQSIELRDKHTNGLFKKRAQNTIDKQKADLAIKQKQLNAEPDE